ncbi:MAG: ribokinase [Rhodoferax sp.]|nr:ribokinase [Rhodoferax sp.]
MSQESTLPAPYIVVLGSLNMDLVLKVPHAPAAGETLLGRSIHHIPGGKGGNQAVACARQGARVSLIGCIGADADGEALRTALQDDGIDTDALRTDAGQPTGTALVMVEDSGQNRIVVIAGANASLQIDEATLGPQLASADFLVTQFETPMAEVVRGMALAQKAGCKVLLNPSPMQPFDAALWPLIDTLVVNEVEAGALAGRAVATASEAAEAGAALRRRGVARVIVTLGGAGAVAIDADGARHHPAPQVQVVDTTAAGDTFLGVVGVALASKSSLDDAVALGIRAAALCVTRPGAQPSIPTRDEVLRSPVAPTWTDL